MVGGMKMMTPKEKLSLKMGWVNDFSQKQIKIIATVEIISAMGLVLGLVVSGLVILAQAATFLLATTMIGATYTHLRRKETSNAVITIVLLVMSVWLGLNI